MGDNIVAYKWLGDRQNITPGWLCDIFSSLVQTEGFEFEARSRDCLPKGFPPEVEGTCHFVLTYKNPCLPAQTPTMDHIDYAVNALFSSQAK